MSQAKKRAETVKQQKELLVSSLPEKISVLGRVFDIKVTNLKGLYGDCTPQKGIIRLSQSQTLEEAKATLFHEAVHAALFVSGMNELLGEKEEALVRCFEHTFSHIVDINKLALDGLDKD